MNIYQTDPSSPNWQHLWLDNGSIIDKGTGMKSKSKTIKKLQYFNNSDVSKITNLN